MAICKFCLQEKKLIKAHLLPKNILQRIHGKERRYVSAELHNLKNHSVRQDDYWDKDILCSDCDNIFSPAEQYFHQFITSRVNQPDRIIKVDDKEILIYENIDEVKLRLFPLIVLWRMSVSKTEAARGVSLGPLEKIVYQYLKKLNPGPYNFFPFVIYSFKDLNDARATFIGAPLPLKIKTDMFYILPISDFILMVRAGKSISDKDFDSSVKDNTIEIINLKGKVEREFIDTIFSGIKHFPKH
jgi:hypothetical protein